MVKKNFRFLVMISLFLFSFLTPSTVTAESTFDDVPDWHWAYDWIERLHSAGVTSGCGGSNYCPEDPVTRAEMAKFLLKGKHGKEYYPPEVDKGTGFFDVSSNYWAAAWIKQLAVESITTGCGNGNYCPNNYVTRAEMAKFILIAKNHSWYSPPDPGLSTGFTDVPINYWASAWIKQLAAEFITSGCGGGNYCPDAPVTRAEMAKLLVLSFSLP